MRKHKIENFVFELIETHETDKEAQEAEIFLIAYYKSIGAQLMNLTKGGDGQAGRAISPKELERIREMGKARRGVPLSEDVKKQISVSLTGRIVPDRIRKNMAIGQQNRAPRSEETRAKMRIASKGRNVGRVPSEAEKAKIRAHHESKGNQIIGTELTTGIEVEYAYPAVACQLLGITDSTMSKILAGKFNRKSSKGYFFRWKTPRNIPT